MNFASTHVDQFPPGDLAREMSAKFNVPIFDTIEQAVTVGGDRIPVEGVISVAEHGSYPYNKKGQHLYPRRRFFEKITDTFQQHGRVVPVFSDKHLGPFWEDAKWMYDRAAIEGSLHGRLVAASELSQTEPRCSCSNTTTACSARF